MSVRRTWARISEVGTGREPDGLCGDRSEHPAHLHESASLGTFWCTARQADREPGRSEARRASSAPQPDSSQPTSSTAQPTTVALRRALQGAGCGATVNECRVCEGTCDWARSQPPAPRPDPTPRRPR